MTNEIRKRDFSGEIDYKATRSSGPGGQNVNKVSTRIELRFNVMESNILSEREKLIILKRLGKKISKDGVLIIVSQTKRSQLRNKEEAVRKLYDYLEKVLKPLKKRISTSPSPGSVHKRLENKRKHSEKKSLRSKKTIS